MKNLTNHLIILIALLLSCLTIFPTANASAQTCSGGWDITGTSGIKTNYQVGETITGNISFKINNPSDVPKCIQQILVGLVDSQNQVIDVKCAYDGIPKVCPQWTTGTVSISWKNPATPGTYRILATQDANYSCLKAKPNFRPKESYTILATITVSTTLPETTQTSPGNWEITGISGINTNYQPKEIISGNISFKINNPANCSSCPQQILVGLVDSQDYNVDIECVFDGIPQVYPQWTTGNGNFNLENPNSPGTYRIVAVKDNNLLVIHGAIVIRRLDHI